MLIVGALLLAGGVTLTVWDSGGEPPVVVVTP